MAKQIIFSSAVREKLRIGISKLADAVKVTLGPSGKVVLYSRDFQDPVFTKDGVTVAKEVELPDFFENMGAQIVRQATSKTASIAGDGTTTATIYTESIFAAGLKNIANGAKPQEVKTGIEMAVNTVVSALENMARPVISTEQIIQVGICSANQDVQIGTIVAKAIEKVGKDGVVTIEEGRTLETTTELVDGFQINRGYVSQHFVTDKETQRAEYDDPFILVTDQKISQAAQLIPLLEKYMKQGGGAGLVLIADDVDGEALGTLAINFLRGAFKVVAIKAPEYGDRRQAQLEDIAAITGATFISANSGVTLQKVEWSHLGRCKKITIDRDTTTIIEGGGNPVAIEARIVLLKSQLDNYVNDFDKEKAQERLAKLTGGVARITVGGATEAEVREKKDRIDDALHACKAATAEGILPGGGISVIYAARYLDDLRKLKGLTDDQKIGIDIIKKAVEAPLRQIVKNTGEDDGAVIARIKSSHKPEVGYNAVTGKFGDMYQFGIIVPAMVERIALQNAASVAVLLLTTECMIAPMPEKPVSDEVTGPSGLPSMMQ